MGIVAFLALVVLLGICVLVFAGLRSEPEPSDSLPATRTVESATVAVADINATDAALSIDRQPDGRVTFRGLLCHDTAERGRAVCAAATEVILAPTKAVLASAAAERRSLTFLHFVAVDGLDFVPEALDGVRYAVRDGSWEMPVPSEDLVLVAARVGSSMWMVVDHTPIRTGETYREFLVAPPARCRIDVVDHAGSALTDLRLLAIPAIPQGVQVSLTTKDTRSRNVPPVRSGNKTPQPPENAVELLRGASSPLLFDACDYPRELWIGKDGYQWELAAWDPEDRTATVQLGCSTELQITVEDVPAGLEQIALDLRRNGRVLLQWRHVRPGETYVGEDVGLGVCELVVSKPSDIGAPWLLRRAIDVNTTPICATTLSLGGADVPRYGSVVVRIADPACVLRSGADLVIRPIQGSLRGEGGAGRRRIRPPASGERREVHEVEFDRVPVGDFLTTLSLTGTSHVVRVEEGKQSVVSVDLTECQQVVLSTDGSGAEYEHLLLDCLSVRARAAVSEQRAPLVAKFASVASRATWHDGAWRFCCSSGRVAVRIRDPRDGSCRAAGILQVAAGPNRFHVTDLGAQRMSFVEVELHGVPIETRVGVVKRVGAAFRGFETDWEPAFVECRTLKAGNKSRVLVEFAVAEADVPTLPSPVSHDGGLVFDEPRTTQSIAGSVTRYRATWK